MQQNFKIDFLRRISADWFRKHANNIDRLRFPQLQVCTLSLRQKLAERYRSVKRIATILSHSKDLNWVYEKLANDDSRFNLIALLAYRALGHFRVKLPLNTPKYWQYIEKIEKELTLQTGVAHAKAIGSLNEFDLTSCHFPVRMLAHPLNILNAFLLQQYRLVQKTRTIEVQLGDVVIDAGACWGDTALYFGEKVGVTGAVYAYEFDPDNLVLFRKNMAMNQLLSGRIYLQEYAVWNKSGQILRFSTNGPATRLVGETEESNAQTLTDSIDQLVLRAKLERLNFIKMDIEGAELEALRGAENSIRKFTPNLAISIYHKPEHFWQIQRYIDGLNLGYKFFIEHFTIHAEETMLFATVS